MADDVNQLYELHVQPLTESEQLRLVERIVDGIARHRNGDSPQRSIMELRGKGADVWRDVDAAMYVDESRSEWDQRP
jgi:hypothetical protein